MVVGWFVGLTDSSSRKRMSMAKGGLGSDN